MLKERTKSIFDNMEEARTYLFAALSTFIMTEVKDNEGDTREDRDKHLDEAYSFLTNVIGAYAEEYRLLVSEGKTKPIHRSKFGEENSQFITDENRDEAREDTMTKLKETCSQIKLDFDQAMKEFKEADEELDDEEE